MAELRPLCSVGDVPQGTMRTFRVGGKEVLVVHHSDGEWTALGNRCTHLRANLGRGSLEGDAVTCPWHGSQFDARTGRVIRWVQRPLWLKIVNVLWPPFLRRGLATYEVEERAGEMSIRS